MNDPVTMEETNGNSEDELTVTDEACPKIKIYDHVMRVLGGNLDDSPRRPEDYFFKVPKVLRLALSVYKESAADIREADKTLHDHYVYTYWMTALRKLQMFRGEREDPVDLSTRTIIRRSSDGDSGQGDDTPETKYDLWRRLSAIVRSDSSSACPSHVDEPNPSYNLRSRKRKKGQPRKRIKRRRRHCPMLAEGDPSDRRSSPKPRLKLCRYFSPKFRSWRKTVRKRREFQAYRDCRSTSDSSSDPDSGTNLPIFRKVVGRKRKDLRLVSEDTMLNVVYHIPYKLLFFHPRRPKLPYMELSLKGIGGALYQIGQLMTFYRKVARDMCLDVTHPLSCSRVSEGLTKDVVIFLAEMSIFCESLFPAAFTFLVSEGIGLRKLKLWAFYKDRIAKQWQGLNLSLHLILFHGDPVAEQMRSELTSYYKAICTLKV